MWLINIYFLIDHELWRYESHENNTGIDDEKKEKNHYHAGRCVRNRRSSNDDRNIGKPISF